MNRSTALAVGFIVAMLCYAGLSTMWVSNDPGWYDALRKPGFQPPDVVFGVIWPLNFLALGIVGVLVSRRAPDSAGTILAVFAVSVGFALGWAYLFYVPHHLGAAAICLGVAAILTWLMVVLVWRISPPFAVGLLVYGAWMSIATALSVAYARLN